MNTFSFFDDIVCINLRSREDKYEYSEELFEKLDIPVRFYIADKHKKGGLYGCFDSHIKVIQEAYDDGLDSILIFEDDVKPTPHYSESIMKQVVKFLKSNEWDIMYLGAGPFNYVYYSPLSFINAPFVDKNILKYNPLFTHAYAVSREGMQKILNRYHDFIGKEHYDIFLSKLKLNSFCVNPTIFEQKMCMGTDNSIGTQDEVRDALEKVFRFYSCELDNNKILYKLTLLRYEYEMKKRTLIYTLSIITMVVILMCLVIARLWRK